MDQAKVQESGCVGLDEESSFLRAGGDCFVVPVSHGLNSTPFESQAGHHHHVSRPFSWSAFTPLDRWSAGLSTPRQCFHCVGVVYVCISVTRLQTNVFHLLGLLCIQLRTTVA